MEIREVPDLLANAYCVQVPGARSFAVPRSERREGGMTNVKVQMRIEVQILEWQSQIVLALEFWA